MELSGHSGGAQEYFLDRQKHYKELLKKVPEFRKLRKENYEVALGWWQENLDIAAITYPLTEEASNLLTQFNEEELFNSRNDILTIMPFSSTERDQYIEACSRAILDRHPEWDLKKEISKYNELIESSYNKELFRESNLKQINGTISHYTKAENWAKQFELTGQEPYLSSYNDLARLIQFKFCLQFRKFISENKFPTLTTKFEWTGNKTELAELIYTLWKSKRIKMNDKFIEQKELEQSVSDLFNIGAIRTADLLHHADKTFKSQDGDYFIQELLEMLKKRKDK